MSAVVPALANRVRTNPGAPLVTYVDQSRGERTELSALSLANAAAKIANALRDEYNLEPGALVRLDLPRHWQLSAWLAGAWTAGMVVCTDADAPADLVVTTVDGASQLGTEAAVVSMHAFGLPISESLPASAHDVTLAVRQQPDAYLFDTPGPNAPALRVEGELVSSANVWTIATDLARSWQLEPGGRLLVRAEEGGRDALLACLAVPLAAGAAVVIAVEPSDVDALRATELVSAIAAPTR